ncbi:DNA repair protein [Micromonospora qiuiae]|nr:DNA repair protein [Micromonospora qiuiae]
MPFQSNDRCQQHTERIWRPRRLAGHFPAQPPYRDHRNGTLTWRELNSLPPGASTRRHLNTR